MKNYPASKEVKVSKGEKIRNRYNQVPHLTQDTNDLLLLEVKAAYEFAEQAEIAD